jgi:hypothetical protein
MTFAFLGGHQARDEAVILIPMGHGSAWWAFQCGGQGLDMVDKFSRDETNDARTSLVEPLSKSIELCFLLSNHIRQFAG